MSEAGSLGAIPQDEPYPGVRRRALDASRATVTNYEFEPGARFPIHRHDQEQITLVQRGTVRMQIEERVHDLAEGGWSVVAGGTPHGITAGPDGAEILAIVVPRRTHSEAYEVLSS